MGGLQSSLPRVTCAATGASLGKRIVALHIILQRTERQLTPPGNHSTQAGKGPGNVALSQWTSVCLQNMTKLQQAEVALRKLSSPESQCGTFYCTPSRLPTQEAWSCNRDGRCWNQRLSMGSAAGDSDGRGRWVAAAKARETGPLFLCPCSLGQQGGREMAAPSVLPCGKVRGAAVRKRQP